MRVLKQIKEPQTIIICDAWFKERTPDFSIYDDECEFSVRNASKISFNNVFSFGHVYILTKDEFIEHINSQHFKDNCSDNEYENQYVVLNDFVGDIGLLVKTDDGVETSKFNIKDYIHHQYDDNPEVIVEIPAEYSVESVDLETALEQIELGNSSILIDILSEETKEDLYGEIESEGLGYWIQHYGYKGDEDDELAVLCVKGRRIMNKIQERLIALGIEV